ncbi:MAG TPA: TraB/GumN family protein [Chitinophagaceae bacterium]|nr:TraB/GumN family protein [Chitinophagaceae bacterium]
MKNILLFGLVLLACHNNNAQQNTGNNTLLWQISGPGITKPSYLYGTIHIMCPDDIVVTDILRAKFNSTRQLYLELDLDDPKTISDAMTGMMMKHDTTLQQLLPKEEYDTVAANFQKLTGIPMMMMEKVQPMLAEAAIYPAVLGCQGEAWEQKFQQMANDRKMELKGLESTKDQLDIFDSIPYKAQAEMLAKSLKDIDSLKISFRQLLEVYKKKDLDSLNILINDDPDFASYEDIMIDRRNAKWIPEIIAESKKMPTFFAVGAGHLGGPKGVIAMLRKQGYTLTPIKYW